MQGTSARDLESIEAANAARRVARILGLSSIGAVSPTSAAVEDVLAGSDGLLVFPLEARQVSPETPSTVAIDAIRAAIAVPAATPEDVATAGAAGLGADELFLIRERTRRLQVVAGTGAPACRTVPAGIVSELRALRHDGPVDEATARQLATLLGARSIRVHGAFCSDRDPVELVVAGWSEDAPEPEPLEIVAPVLALALDVLEQRHEAVELRMRRVRTTWAAEIHDGLTQALTATLLEMHALLERAPEQDAPGLRRVTTDVRRSLLAVRNMLAELTDAADVLEGERTERYVRDVAERWQIETAIDLSGDVDEAPRAALSAARAVIREAIANAARHADAGRVAVRVDARNDALHVEVSDDGRGFDPASIGNGPRHLGLSMMRARATDAGGSLKVESKPGHGTRVIARVPLARAGRAGEQGEER